MVEGTKLFMYLCLIMPRLQLVSLACLKLAR